jgi:hypothetical protein
MRVEAMKKDVFGKVWDKRLWLMVVTTGMAGVVAIGPVWANGIDISKLYEDFSGAFTKFEAWRNASNEDSKLEAGQSFGSNFNIASVFGSDGRFDMSKLSEIVRRELPRDDNPSATSASVAAQVAAKQALSTKAQEEREKYMKTLVTKTSGFAQEAAQASADGQGLQSSQDVLKKILEQNAALAKINQAAIQMSAQTARGIDDNNAQLGTLNQSVGALVDENRAREQERRKEAASVLNAVNQVNQNLKAASDF